MLVKACFCNFRIGLATDGVNINDKELIDLAANSVAKADGCRRAQKARTALRDALAVCRRPGDYRSERQERSTAGKLQQRRCTVRRPFVCWCIQLQLTANFDTAPKELRPPPIRSAAKGKIKYVAPFFVSLRFTLFSIYEGSQEE